MHDIHSKGYLHLGLTHSSIYCTEYWRGVVGDFANAVSEPFSKGVYTAPEMYDNCP